ncbi:membrane-bound alkaline phosphatase-like [Pieris brassicae]|uniref:membrane-bound alkaline phosphatase-like n=1 Tax=Pieris brassicae TaxID=7116 RepID=UPI001E65FC1B|nr:membrane-bound alkaline phosphatase-like [Pieris brassicae]
MLWKPYDISFILLIIFIVNCCSGDEYHNTKREIFRSQRYLRNEKERNSEYWMNQAQETVKRHATRTEGHPRTSARNIVLFLGDGMSVPTLTAARTLLGQRNGRTGEEAELYFETFPTLGLAKTYCVDAQIADSACTATSYLCGVKTNRGTIGVTGTVERGDCPTSVDPHNHVESIAAWALADGRDAGIVTSARVTHASPAGAYARVAQRDWESDADVRKDGHDSTACPDIAYQLVHQHPGIDFKVILGGGRREFLPNNTVDEEGTFGKRLDGRNLIDEWQIDKMAKNVSNAYLWNRQQLLNIKDQLPEYLLGLFESSHLQYNMERNADTEPTLAELTETAIRSLSRNKNGFFLFVEGGRIDHAHHENQATLALDETIELSAAVARASELLDETDSLLVVTSDHAHVMAFNGYTHRGGDVLGPSDSLGDDGLPYMTLSYTNGPGYRASNAVGRVDVTKDKDFGSTQWLYPASVPLSSETHGGDDVAVFARGPHHAMFSGLYEQNVIPHLMAYAACIGPGKHVCDNS